MGKVVPAGPGPKFFFDWGRPKICFWRDRDRDLKLFPAGTGTKIFSPPGPDRDEIFFLTGTGTGTRTKNDWSCSCLSKTNTYINSFIDEFFHIFLISFKRTGGVKPRNRPPRVIRFCFCRTVRKSAQSRLQVELGLLRPFMSFEIANDFRMYIICACWW
jgi:hypothetical protein